MTFLLIILLPTSLYSQGCEEASSDEGVQVKGFIQPQYSYFLNGEDANGKSLNENSFNFNRTRLGVVGSIPYDISYYFFMEVSPFKGSTQPSPAYLLDGFVSYNRFGPYAKISIGQFKSPFGLEQNTSCSGLYSIYRSDVVGQLAGPQRDIGLLVYGGNDTTLLRYYIAVMNGTGKGIYDDNVGKDYICRLLIQPIEGLQLGGSFRTGKRNPTDMSEKQNDIYRYAGELKFTYKDFVLQGEYLYGTDKLYSTTKIPIYGGCGGIVGFDTKTVGSYNKSGYWVMASYKTKWNLEPIIKYDNYEPDLAVIGDWNNNLTFGFNYFLNDWTRVQCNYIYRTKGTTNLIYHDEVVFQIQAKF